MKYALLIFLLLLVPIASAHPHPFVFVEGSDENIQIYALHVQDINLSYLQENLVIQDCEITRYTTEDAYLQRLEMLITIHSSCENHVIEKNTLFQDFWNIPLTYRIVGFGEADFITIPSLSNVIFGSDDTYQVSSNPIALIGLLIALGFLFSVMSELPTLIVPISLHGKKTKDRYLWIKAGILHLAVTYAAIYFALNVFAGELIRFSGLLIILVGISLFFEHRLHHKVSPLALALIPDGAAFFFALVVFQDQPILAYFAPLLMALGEFAALKIGSKLPLPQKILLYTPHIIIAMGIIASIRYLL